MLEGAMYTTRGEVIAHLTQLRTLGSTIATCLVVSVCNTDTDLIYCPSSAYYGIRI